MRVPACALTAATTSGWAWPRRLTAMPATRSRYSRPESSYTRHPRPRTNVTGSLRPVCIRHLSASSALVIRLLGDHGSDAGFGEELQQERVWRPAVNDVGQGNPVEGPKTCFELGDHPAGDLPVVDPVSRIIPGQDRHHLA